MTTESREIFFVSREEAIELHRRSIERYGGDPSLRDLGLLDSALAQPQAMFSGQYLHESIPQMAAAYCYHLAANHAFVDGNKRIAAIVAHLFLRMNDWWLDRSQEQYEAMVMSLAASELDKAAVTAFFQQHAKPSDV